MYKNILLPTDGSELSREAAAACVQLARDAGARITALHVVPSPRADLLEAWLHDDPHYERRRRALFEKFAGGYLDFVAQLASQAGVQCTPIKAEGGEAWRVIVRETEALHCDLVFMASHGWGGPGAELLGSETLKVLVHSRVPVLVFKPGFAARAGATPGGGQVPV